MNLDTLHTKVKQCNNCTLREGCKQVVPGDGAQSARIMFVGEAPGENENIAGVPFIGRSGNLLRQQIKKTGLKENMYYITNTVRCRPPDNRDPYPKEIEACWPWLAETLKIIRPKIIVPLGRPATRTLAFKLGFSREIGQLTITKLAGKPLYLEDRSVYVYPMFHPAFALRGNDRRSEFNSHMQYLGKAYLGWLKR